MANNYRQRSGDRYDGRIIHTLSAYNKLIPFINKNRSDSQGFYEQSFEVENADAWLEQQRGNGYESMGMLHLFIAAYVRCVAALPAVNRFVSGRRIYARDSIDVVLPVSRGSGSHSQESEIKVEYEPTDTVFDVYNKTRRALDKFYSSENVDRAEELAEKIAKFPRFLVRFIVWLLNAADFLGLLPKKILDASPFHGSIRISDLGALGIGPMRRSISNFGNLPFSLTLGARRKRFEINERGAAVERQYIDASFVIDKRTTDDRYYAKAFRYMEKLISNPEQLEIPPEVVKEDIF